VTGPGEVERDKNGDGVLDEKASLAPSTRRGMAGEGGLLVADEVLLPELFEASSATPSLCVVLAEADGEAGGDVLPEGVPKKQNFWINSLYSADWRSGFSEDKPGMGAPVVWALVATAGRSK